jgi:hypothetical protein
MNYLASDRFRPKPAVSPELIQALVADAPP